MITLDALVEKLCKKKTLSDDSQKSINRSNVHEVNQDVYNLDQEGMPQYNNSQVIANGSSNHKINIRYGNLDERGHALVSNDDQAH